MTKKVQKILVTILLAALIISLMAASLVYTFTYGRYEGGSLGDSTYDDTIEFIGTEKYVVNNPEELNDAIENGYSYIQISEDAEQPFVITTEVQDVASNLVLDLNGTVVVRNSRNPMLNVSRGVSVVLVYDSKGGGAFYNPVGSALRVSGGIMTIGSGSYESGPRANEYDTAYQGTLSAPTVDVALYSRGGVTDPDAVDRVSGTSYSSIDVNGRVPVISAGNYYRSSGGSGYSFLPEDTFLVQTEEVGRLATEADAEAGIAEGDLLVDGRKFEVPCDVASCDFYYYYQTTEHEDGTATYDVIYGYWDVKELAQSGTQSETQDDGTQTDVSLTNYGLIWPYAAIRMTAGEGYARGGDFVNQFDVANTYGILSLADTANNAGKLIVSQASNENGTNFTAHGAAVCIRCEAGEVTVSGGNFSSELGNTIEMNGGTLDITAGTFNKDVSQGATGEEADNGSAIDMSGGTLTIDGSLRTNNTYSVQFQVTGSDVNGITAQGGTIDASCFSMALRGTQSKGIYAAMQNSVATGYDVSVSEADISVGDSDTNTGNFGIQMNNGYIQCDNLTLNVFGRDSAGILAQVENATPDRANVVLKGTYRGVIRQSGTELSSAAVMLEGGHIDLQTSAPTQTGKYNITSNGLGIVVANGNISQSSGGLSVNTTRGTAIYLRGGSLTQASGATLSVTSTIAEGTTWAQGDTSGDGSANIYNGVYVRGGSLTCNGTLNVTHTGMENDLTSSTSWPSWEDPPYYDYQNQVIKSYAVRVEGTANTSVTINQGKITNLIGGGLYVTGAMGQQNVDIAALSFNDIVKDRSTVVDLVNVTIQTAGVGDRVTRNIQSNWDYYLSTEGGHAVEIDGGVLRVSDGVYTARQGDGIRIQGGIAFIEGGCFVGQDDGASLPGAGASYAFKVYGGHARVNGGIFGRESGESTNYQGNGAFIMQGNAYITRANIQAGGTTGFGVWTDATVTFTPADSATNTIYVYGASTGMTLENGNSYPELEVTINGGTFEAGKQGNPYGIWYGNRNATLTITGGTFTGDDAGLRIDENPGQIRYDRQYNPWPPEVRYTWYDERNIHISGGTFSSINDGVGGLRVCDILACVFNEPEGGYNTSSNISNVTDANGISVSGAWNGDANYDTGINSSLSRGEVTVKKS